MASLAPKLPITLDSGDGYTSIKSIRTLLKQNFKMLILTNPGERVMEPEFGVGIRQYLFQNFSESVYTDIDVKIREQVSIYLPVIRIDKLEFGTNNIEDNSLAIRIEFSIPDIASRDLLEFTI
jgi:phage baseplate assembly protein W|tara:strand:+ start:52 stop:420 length:369 start_codon:yes stop_codon:yes gene_type:complete